MIINYLNSRLALFICCIGNFVCGLFLLLSLFGCYIAKYFGCLDYLYLFRTSNNLKKIFNKKKRIAYILQLWPIEKDREEHSIIYICKTWFLVVTVVGFVVVWESKIISNIWKALKKFIVKRLYSYCTIPQQTTPYGLLLLYYHILSFCLSLFL